MHSQPSRPKTRTILALAGLPGTGKSTLAAALCQALDAPMLDKDRIRFERFGPDRIEYSRAQDDECCRAMHARAQELFDAGAAIVVFDGRTYSKRYQVKDLEAFAARAGADLTLIECTAGEEIVRARLEQDAHAGGHPAGNRSFELYLALRESAQEITRERFVIDTGSGTLEDSAARCLAWLASRTK